MSTTCRPRPSSRRSTATSSGEPRDGGSSASIAVRARRPPSPRVRGGEVVLVTDGYHPFAATEGDDAYYLNALAGDWRTMACSFDPDLDWVRASGESEAADARLPLVGRAIAGPTATS